ncbi:MAG: aminopeptidase [Treponema sp.]|jgi:predicted aminopeptidase|nr:aminopeptidase [Treponema sp.]
MTYKPFSPWLPPICALALLLGTCALFSGCYTLTQGTTLLGYLGRAVPLEELAAANAAGGINAGGINADDTARFVERVMDIRRFAMEELGLKESANYTKYVELDRDYLAAVVSAAAKDSFTRYEWWFPIVGKVPYKGFFKVEDAHRERDKLLKKDLDVWVRGVDAFSTLGWFKDPLYSYMRSYSDYQLADLLIHELLHATVYIKGQSQFDEELAEFVGTEGARLYIEKKYGRDSAEYQKLGESAADSRAYVAYLQGLIGELQILYQSDVSREEKLAQKAQIIKASQERFTQDYEGLFTGDNYRSFSELAVNNAYLELYRLYYEGGSFYRDLYEKSGSDLHSYIAAAKTIKVREKNPKAALTEALGL